MLTSNLHVHLYYTYTFLHTHTHTHTHTPIHTPIHIPTHTHTHTERERKRDRDSERERERWTHFILYYSNLFGGGAGFLCVALAVLELTLWTKLSSNSQRSGCLCLPSAGIKGMSHHSWVVLFCFEEESH
jgi:hypothetical protein